MLHSLLRCLVIAGCLALSARAVVPGMMPVRGICAHRGGATTHPENTLPAFREAVRVGAHMIELDLALTRDGELVLMHDATVNRTTNGKGRVIDLTLAEIKQLDAGAWKDARFAGTRVPTLAEALAMMPRNVWLNLDFKADARFAGKSADAARRVAELVVAAAKAVAPGLLICSMDRKPDPADYVQAAIAQKADFIQLRDCAKDARLPTWIAALKAAKVRINYFYTNDSAEAARLLAAGVDFVLTDATETVLAKQAGLAPLRPLWP